MTTPSAFDPAEHTVDDVRSYLDDASPEEVQRVLDAERAGKNRTTILSAFDTPPAAPADPAAPAAPAVPAPAPAPTGETRTTDSTTIPGETKPGEAPADTTDPSERVTSTPVRPGEEAKAAGTVNAVTLLPPGSAPGGNPAAGSSGSSSSGRVETYKQVTAEGKVVTVTHNLDTGATSYSE